MQIIITFCGRTIYPKLRNTPDTPDFWLGNKIFHNNLCVFIVISTILYLIYLLSLHKSLVYPPFVYILYDECNEDMTGEYSSARKVFLREKLPFLKECKNEMIHLFFLHFNFWPAIEKWIAKIIHDESLKNKNCSIGISCGVVWFHRIHLKESPPEVFLKNVFLKTLENSQENTCTGVSFPALLFVRWGEK